MNPEPSDAARRAAMACAQWVEANEPDLCFAAREQAMLASIIERETGVGVAVELIESLLSNISPDAGMPLIREARAFIERNKEKQH